MSLLREDYERCIKELERLREENSKLKENVECKRDSEKSA